MSGYTASDLKKALKKSGLTVVYADGWDSAEIDPFGISPSMGVVLHHTANGGSGTDANPAPSVPWQIHNEYFPVRAAHFNVGRTGIVTVLAARGAYHAGAGGPVTIGSGTVPYNQGNKYLVGIEIESQGTAAYTDAGPTDGNGMRPAQVDAATKLAVTLCRLMGVNQKSVIRHRDFTDGGFDGNPWLPTRGRKSDVLQPLDFWRKRIRKGLAVATVTSVFGR